LTTNTARRRRRAGAKRVRSRSPVAGVSISCLAVLPQERREAGLNRHLAPEPLGRTRVRHLRASATSPPVDRPRLEKKRLVREFPLNPAAPGGQATRTFRNPLGLNRHGPAYLLSSVERSHYTPAGLSRGECRIGPSGELGGCVDLRESRATRHESGEPVGHYQPQVLAGRRPSGRAARTAGRSPTESMVCLPWPRGPLRGPGGVHWKPSPSQLLAHVGWRWSCPSPLSGAPRTAPPVALHLHLGHVVKPPSFWPSGRLKRHDRPSRRRVTSTSSIKAIHDLQSPPPAGPSRLSASAGVPHRSHDPSAPAVHRRPRRKKTASPGP